jgi:hypothetical protein
MKIQFLKILWKAFFYTLGIDISFDIKYKAFSYYLLEFRADYQTVDAMLENKKVKPVEYRPNEARIQIVGCEMRSVEMTGAYNELSIQVPVISPDNSSGETFAHLFLPVDLEFARWAGVNISGFPKFLANIIVRKRRNRVDCQLFQDGELILAFRMFTQPGNNESREWNFIGKRKQELVKTRFEIEGEIYSDTGMDDVVFELSKHPLSYKIRNIMLDNIPERVEAGYQVSGILRKPVKIKGEM